MENLEFKLNNLKDYIASLKSVAVAFSSGVDSTFLLKTCSMVLNQNCTAITVKSPFFPKKELEEAIDFCKKEKIKHIILDIDILKNNDVIINPTNRCYLCKKEIFKNIKKVAYENNINYILEGSNLDDDSDYRPGMKAIRELNILSPLKHADLNKAEIRLLSKKMDLKTYKKPSFACLASRIPYGEKITLNKLNMVEKGEKILSDLGFSQYRVRVHNNLARIEILPDEFKKIIKEDKKNTIVTEFKKLGFSYVSMDLAGYRTGSLNEVINN